MKIFNINPYSSVFITLILISSVMFTGCKNSAAGNEEEEHLLTGAVLKMNGEVIVRYEGSSSITGSVTVAEGAETNLISIFFLDENGDEFQPEESGHSLQWSVKDTTIAEVERHSDEGEWSLHIVGKTSGTTTATFELWHGEEHADFRAAGIPITVE